MGKLTLPSKLKFMKVSKGFQIQGFYRKPFGAKVLFGFGLKNDKRYLIIKNPFRRPGV